MEGDFLVLNPLLYGNIRDTVAKTPRRGNACEKHENS